MRRHAHKLAPPTSIVLRLPPPSYHHPDIRVPLSEQRRSEGRSGWTKEGVSAEDGGWDHLA